MSVQKFVTYNSVNTDGQKLDSEYTLALNIVEKSGNYLVHKDILRQQISKKQGTSSTKTRSEVRGGGRKPWKQKGTGRARAGSNRSPLWKGGGIIFGPKPRKTKLKLNKKERKLALQTLFYNRCNNISVIENLESAISFPSTKLFCKICKNCQINNKEKVLIIVSDKTTPLQLSTQNIKNIKLIAAGNLNSLSLLEAKQIIITPSALKEIKEIYCE